jgi:hypothetical protein
LRWLLSAIGTDGAAQFEESDAVLPFEAEDPMGDPVGQEIDEALEQIGSEGCRVCILCGAIVASDGTVLG